MTFTITAVTILFLLLLLPMLLQAYEDLGDEYGITSLLLRAVDSLRSEREPSLAIIPSEAFWKGPNPAVGDVDV